ncbi:MAG: hypothetical protein RDV48_18500 [Candidatus Eremiobacteraeota bacterium]|nr:hypothetical protein [Candidatus Eremiobacteraeota bacterium]
MKVAAKAVVVLLVTLIMGGSIFLAVTKLPGLLTGTEGKDSQKVGVVDFGKLLKAHQDWKKLDGIDKQIADIEQKMNNAPSGMQKLGLEQAERLKKAQIQAEAELKQEISGITSSLEKQKAAFEAQMAGEVKKIQEEMSKLKAQAKNAQGQTPPEQIKPYSEQMKDFSRDLIILRDRQVAAKRLELQKKAKEKIDADKGRLESELSSYEQQLARENQQEKLNIQLKLQVNQNDEEHQHLKEELAKISDEESRLKEKKKNEIAAEMDKLGNVEMDKIDKEVLAYKAKIDQDISAQLSRKQVQLGGGKEPIVASNPALSEYQRKGMELTKAFQAKQKEMEAKLLSANEDSRRKLEEKKRTLESQLKTLEKSVMKEVLQNRDKLAKTEMERMERSRLQIEKLQRERGKLYSAMESDIKDEVALLARKERVPFVVGMYIVNVEGTDLTDKALEMMKKAQATSGK